VLFAVSGYWNGIQFVEVSGRISVSENVNHFPGNAQIEVRVRPDE